MQVIGFDTSNYTTSIAYFDGVDGVNCSKLLPVRDGALGLRQSDAVFHHTQSLPELSGRLFSDISVDCIRAIGASSRPRAVEGSYMPCFLVGVSHAKLLADAFGVPLFYFSHQQGHVAASLWSAGEMDLMDRPHLAWHLSGGTTELLYVEPTGRSVNCTRIGGTSDISAGQLIDRTGQLLGLPFPSGKEIDRLSQQVIDDSYFRVKYADLSFSLSGVQNKVQDYYRKCENISETAGYVLRCISQVIYNVTRDAMGIYPGVPVVFSGGVASNSYLRTVMEPLSPIFSPPAYSTDNAMGIAVLTHRTLEG